MILPFAKAGKLYKLGPELGDGAKKASGGAEAVNKGKRGEVAVREQYDIGEKSGARINGRNRIFDGLTADAVSEVKNVKKQSYTRQIKDYEQFARDTDRRLDLYVAEGARLTGPLRDAWADPDSPINIIRFKP